MKPFYEVVKRPLITEKAVIDRENSGRYTFEVAATAGKNDIRRAIEAFFNVDVKRIRTLIVRGKIRRVGRYYGKRPSWKKAIVTLAKGQKIELFEAKP